ncbi:MAG TPA: DNA polymerase III subunit gamma/tau, partial [Anaeromyxobacteraceae bacterium]
TKGAPAPTAATGAAPAAPAPPQSLAAAEQAERDVRSASVKANARSHPRIQEAAQILDGEVTKIEEL